MYYTNKLKGKPLQMMGYKVTGSKRTDAIMQLEVNDADYDVKMPEDFPFEETYNKAIERYGVKGPWD